MLGDQTERGYFKSVQIFLSEVIVLQSTAILWILQKSGAENLFLTSHIVYLPSNYTKQWSFGCATHNQVHTSKYCSENWPLYSHCRTIAYLSGLNKFEESNTVHNQVEHGVLILTECIMVRVMGQSLSPLLFVLHDLSNLTITRSGPGTFWPSC